MSNSDDLIKFFQCVHRTNEKIELHPPVFKGNEKQYLNEAINSTFVSSVGPFVDRFESLLAKTVKAKRAVAVVNGTAALQIALAILGVRKNHIVLTQALTFVATANSILYNQADPAFIDVDIDSLGMSPEALKKFLSCHCKLVRRQCIHKSTGRRVSACMPMHTFGFPSRIDEIVKVCDEWQIPVVEDAAEALGSKLKGRSCGKYGKLGIYSFNGNKIATCGGGGAIITDDENLADYAKHLTTTAKQPHKWEYSHNELGYNYRMPNLNAAVGCAQLEKLDCFLKNKKKLAEIYMEYFSANGFKFITERKNSEANYWLMTLQLKNKKELLKFLTDMNKAMIQTRPAWRLLFKLPFLRNKIRDNQLNAQFLADRLVNIPSNVG